MRFILLIVAFLVTTESKVLLKFLNRNRDNFSAEATTVLTTIDKNEDFESTSPRQPSYNEEYKKKPSKTNDARNNEQLLDPRVRAESTTTLIVPCQDDTGFASLHLNSLDNVGLYQQYGIDTLGKNEYYNAKFLLNTLEEIKSLPESDVSSAVAKADKLGFFTGHLKNTDTLSDVTSKALRELNGTALEKLAKFKVAFTLQSNAILYLKAVMALDRIKDEYGEVKPKAFRKSKKARHLAKVIRQLEGAVHSLRQGMTKPHLLSYGNILDLVDILKKEDLLRDSLAVLEQEKDWVEDKISEYLDDSDQAKEYDMVE